MPFPVDIKWIKETETRLGVRFPASYVIAMSKMNGGAVEVETDVFWLHPILDKSDKKRIQRTCNSVCRETTSMRELEYFQNELVSIGQNGGGDALVLRPMAKDPKTLEHSVYWWDHETSELHLAADDFVDLNKS
ncbi:MAG: SMI1/KNR4 family protein [Planctomycetota bacterium]